ncbi:hypothetical protein AURDEDRAFT_63155 [Auricularia subglabra TFB-10046 SS5]|nr:hypothetical protein AURDEDRAFT_63155 [Auricularia subglabra TFB-10046 SS5]
MATLRAPRSEGGLNAFCASERNDAQYLTWLGQLMKTSQDRPKWCYVADEIVRLRMIGDHKKRIPDDSVTNPFVQAWRTNTQRIPNMLKQVVRVAKKYDLVVDDPLMPNSMKEEMVIWSHPALLHPDMLSDVDDEYKCLRKNHAVRTVEHLVEIAELDDSEHESTPDCACDNCVTDRVEGCTAPHACQATAEALLCDISEKWNPSNPSVSAECPGWTRDEARVESPESEKTFKRQDPSKGRLQDYTRIFTRSLSISGLSAREIALGDAPKESTTANSSENTRVLIVVAGEKCETRESRIGYCIAIRDRNLVQEGRPCPGRGKSILHGLAYALVDLTAMSNDLGRLEITATSATLVDALTKHLHRNEREGWVRYGKDAKIMRCTAAALRSRPAGTSFVLLTKKAARDNEDHRIAYWLAEAAMHDPQREKLSMSHLIPFDRPGREVVGITQKEAHREIRRWSSMDRPARRRTVTNLALIKHMIKVCFGWSPSDTQIWKSIQSKDMSRGARVFIWKGIHGGHKVGDYFSKMPRPWADFAKCPTCGCTESMHHILFECPDHGQKVVWELVRTFLRHKAVEDFTPNNLGLIWGCALVTPGVGGSRNSGADRAYRKVVSESAFLIWKMRCEKRIEYRDNPDWKLPDRAVIARWDAMMRRMVSFDYKLNATMTGHVGKRYALTAATWRDLTDPSSACATWSRTGGLVGRGRVQGVG